MNISTKALRTRVREVLDCLDRGESVILTYRGKQRARLVRVEQESKSSDVSLDELPVFGMWSDRGGDLGDVEAYVRAQRESRFHVD